MKSVKEYIETRMFGVCHYLGDKMGVSSNTIRKYFIYMSFFSFGSPVIIYFFVAFWMNVKKYISKATRNPIWGD